MEFSYRIREDEFLKSEKPEMLRIYNKIFLWGCILLSLVFVWYELFGPDAGQPNSGSQTVSGAVVQERSSGSFFARNHPLFIIAGVLILSWPYGVFVFFPRRLRRKYQANASMQGDFTLNITPDAVTLQYSGGADRTEWKVYEHWSEKKDVIWLGFPQGGHQLVGVAALSDAQRDELRSILAAHLPK